MTRHLQLGMALMSAGLAAACGDGPNVPNSLQVIDSGGSGQTGAVGEALSAPLSVQVLEEGQPRAGIAVTWSIVQGGGSVPASTVTDNQGMARAAFTLGPITGTQAARATVPDASGSPVVFTATAVPGPPAGIAIYAGDTQCGGAGQLLEGALAVRLGDRFNNPIAVAGFPVAWQVVTGGGTLSDDTTETDAGGIARVQLTLGPATGSNTVRAVLAATPDTQTFTLSGMEATGLLTTVPVAPNYGLHDTFVRAGMAFLFAWDTGVLVYDIGNGVSQGSFCAPVRVGSVATQNGNVHNGWWFWNPASGEKRYLFVGEEGPSAGGSTTGDIHVVDVSDLSRPREVGSLHLDGAGAHNFWMDEAAQVLYAAFYNGGVVKLSVAGASATNPVLVANERPGGVNNTFVWGVQLYNGSLYAIDMLSGLWQLSAGNLQTLGGGFNVPERYSSDLWLHGGYAYTGTWGNRGTPGNAVKIWQLDANGAPVLVDSIITPGIGTVSDVEVSSDGKVLLFSAEGGPNAGVWLYTLADPAAPSFLQAYLVNGGVHTTTMATINGRRLVFAAKNPGSTNSPGLLIYDITSLVP